MSEQTVLSVSDAVSLAKTTINTLPQLAICGEITDFRGANAKSGHYYFKLKDKESSVDIAVWKWDARGWGKEVLSALHDGLNVTLVGKFDVYAKSGKLSFIGKRIVVSGEGFLRQQVAALADRLRKEGLMSDDRKRPIPRFCTRVAVCTSLSGSVLDDVKRTLSRRNPLVEILVANCPVQGADAAPQIIDALNVAAAAKPDCILLVRGGGSYEDLMCFNDESLARAVASCPVPVVTGIGHEPDVTICDLVADRRSSTPTGAAESVAPTVNDLAGELDSQLHAMSKAMLSTLDAATTKTNDRAGRISRAMKSQLVRRNEAVDALARHRCLQDPTSMIDQRMNDLAMTEQRLFESLPRTVDSCSKKVKDDSLRLEMVGKRLIVPYKREVSSAATTLNALSPLNVLNRGYAIVMNEEGHVVADTAAAQPGDAISVRMSSGFIDATVTGIRSNGPASSDMATGKEHHG